MSEPNVLYHYCSLDTFFNIIKNRSLWLSDISKSNQKPKGTTSLRSVPFGEFFCWYTFGKQSLLIYELILLYDLFIPDKDSEHHYCYGDYALYKEELP